jgi:hypothetical protein
MPFANPPLGLTCSVVTPDQELMILFGAMHVIALALGGVLFWMFLHSDTVTPWEPPEDEEGGGGGGNDRLQRPPKPPRPGGIPLPDAVQSRERFREPGRLADRHLPQRRREHAPERPRVPQRT